MIEGIKDIYINRDECMSSIDSRYILELMQWLNDNDLNEHNIEDFENASENEYQLVINFWNAFDGRVSLMLYKGLKRCLKIVGSCDGLGKRKSDISLYDWLNSLDIKVKVVT